MQGWHECKTSMTVVEDIKQRITIYTSNSSHGYLPKRTKDWYLNK